MSPSPIILSVLGRLVIGSWDYKIVQDGRDLRRSLLQPPAQSRVSYKDRPDCSRLYPVSS